jgi:hypothetical protein
MRRSRVPLALLFLAVPLLGCASGPTSGAGTPRDPEVITLAEIEATQARTALEIVQQLRPSWMTRHRGERSFSTSAQDYTRVVVDDMAPREFTHLSEISRAALLELRFLSAREATLLYGTGFNEGIIKVKTRR